MKKLATTVTVICMTLFATSANAQKSVAPPHLKHHTYQVINWAHAPGVLQIERNITAHHPHIVFRQCKTGCYYYRVWPVWIETRKRWKHWGPQPIAYHTYAFDDWDPVAWGFGVIRNDPDHIGGRLLRVVEGMQRHPWQ